MWGRVKRFVRFHGNTSAEMGEVEIAAFLSALTIEGRVASGTQNQALAALLFMYRDLLGVQISMGRGVVHAKRPKRLPVVMTAEEVWRVIEQVDGAPLPSLGWMCLQLKHGRLEPPLPHRPHHDRELHPAPA